MAGTTYETAIARRVAAKTLGKPLPHGAEVHHVNRQTHDNRPCNLVICQDRAYHRLLHRRMRERDARRNPKPVRNVKTVQIRDMDISLWWQFRSRAAHEDISVKDLIARLVRDYVNAPNEVRPA